MALAVGAELGDLEARVTARLHSLSEHDVVARIWSRDHTVWSENPAEISSRLGWLDAPARSRREIADLERFAAEAAGEGRTDAVLLGMGGSSLAPEVLARSSGTREGMARLSVLDTTHPDAVADLEQRTDLDSALFVVASKSGTTIETRSHMAYFLDRVHDPSRFVAITDPGTPLEEEAKRRGFRRVFSAPADVGGRYSALTVFGLVPASLIGADVAKLLDDAVRAADTCRDGDLTSNPGAILGAALGEAVLAGRDKCTFVGAGPLGGWAEQLLAESTGKERTGVVPVDDEALGPPEAYGDDRLFVALGREPPPSPFVTISHDRDDLGGAFFTLEFATAVAGHVLGINPFDQPNVQEAKDRTGEVLASGALPDESLTSVDDLLAKVRPRDYVAIQAFAPPRDDLIAALQAVRVRIRDRFRVGTTLGFGPRFLHSTGQLHKGGPETGVFVQVLAEPAEDRSIPGQPFTFGRLIAAQAAGDLASLRALGRRVGRVALDDLLAWGG